MAKLFVPRWLGLKGAFQQFGIALRRGSGTGSLFKNILSLSPSQDNPDDTSFKCSKDILQPFLLNTKLAV